MKRLLLLLPVLLFASCNTPAGQRILDKALMVGEARLDKWLGIPMGAVVSAAPAPAKVPEPALPQK